jgi:hypothetical protein
VKGQEKNGVWNRENQGGYALFEKQNSNNLFIFNKLIINPGIFIYQKIRITSRISSYKNSIPENFQCLMLLCFSLTPKHGKKAGLLINPHLSTKKLISPLLAAKKMGIYQRMVD